MTSALPGVLLLNPNTTVQVTDKLLRHALQHAGSVARFEGITARFGAPYISDEVGFAVAGHAALDAWAAHASSPGRQPPQALLVACFGDPGLMALRACAGIPVTGLAEAAFRKAARAGRFTVVTAGMAWGPMLERLAWSLGFGPALAGIHTVAPTGGELAQAPERAMILLRQACHEALERHPADALILGGAGLAGLAATLQEGLPVPLIDSVQAGIDEAVQLACQPNASQQAHPGTELGGVSAELQALFPQRLRA